VKVGENYVMREVHKCKSTWPHAAGMTSSRTKFDRHAAVMVYNKYAYKVLIVKPEKKAHMEDPSIDARVSE
jgi:hypothetical protein